MNIQDFCNLLNVGNPLQQMLANINLERDMHKICETDKGWRYFCYLLEKGNTGCTDSISKRFMYDPSNILALCLKLGIKTDTDLYNFVNYMKTINVEGLIDCHSPTLKELLTIDPDNPIKEMNYISVKNIIETNCPIEDTLRYSEQFDSIYLSPNKKQVEYCLQQCVFDKLEYKAQGRDCEDYAFLFRTFLARNGYGNLTIPYISINVYDEDGTIKFAHGINLIIYNDGTCQFMEPQSDRLWNPQEKMPWGLNKYDFKIRYVLF